MWFENNSFKTQNGACALLVAAENGHVDVTQSLLQYRATVDLKRNVSVSGGLEHNCLF